MSEEAAPLSMTVTRTRQTEATRQTATLVGQGIVVALLLVLASAFATAFVPRLLGYETLVVQGGSMGKAQPPGSLVIASAESPFSIEVGDVIVLRERQAAMGKIHRVVSLRRSGGKVLVRTKGDANRSSDATPSVLADRVVVARITIPYLGLLIAFVSAPLGWAILVGLPGAALIVSSLASIWGLDRPRPNEA